MLPLLDVMAVYLDETNAACCIDEFGKHTIHKFTDRAKAREGVAEFVKHCVELEEIIKDEMYIDRTSIDDVTVERKGNYVVKIIVDGVKLLVATFSDVTQAFDHAEYLKKKYGVED